jgi:dihydroxyacid dehydratase/phosphogluconate dehydratase
MYAMGGSTNGFLHILALGVRACVRAYMKRHIMCIHSRVFSCRHIHAAPSRLAAAHEADVPFTIDDMQRVGARVPIISNMSPHGKYHMCDVDAIGKLNLNLNLNLNQNHIQNQNLNQNQNQISHAWQPKPPPNITRVTLTPQAAYPLYSKNCSLLACCTAT